MSLFTRNIWSRRRAFWYSTFLGRVLSLAIVGGIAGYSDGGLVGLSNLPYGINPYPWTDWMGVIGVMGGIFMAIVGLLVGMCLFGGLSVIERSWSKQRRHRFSLAIRKILRLLFSILFLTKAGSFVFWLGTGRMTTSKIGFGNFLVNTDLLIFPVASLLLVITFGYKSSQEHKPAYRKQIILTERLLPID